MSTKDRRETTSFTAGEANALADLAEAAGMTRSAMLRLLALDGLRRYTPGGVVGTVDTEARAARLRLDGIRAEAPVPA